MVTREASVARQAVAESARGTAAGWDRRTQGQATTPTKRRRCGWQGSRATLPSRSTAEHARHGRTTPSRGAPCGQRAPGRTGGPMSGSPSGYHATAALRRTLGRLFGACIAGVPLPLAAANGSDGRLTYPACRVKSAAAVRRFGYSQKGDCRPTRLRRLGMARRRRTSRDRRTRY